MNFKVMVRTRFWVSFRVRHRVTDRLGVNARIRDSCGVI